MALFSKVLGHQPLAAYPWAGEIDRLLQSAIGVNPAYHAFLFDVVMSLAYIDTTAGIEHLMERCDHIVYGYNLNLGFINLCSPCYHEAHWQYQKAAKPESGALGKLSSEITLKFIEHLSPSFVRVQAIGGSDSVDAIIEHQSGLKILAEVKSAPLMTYPLLAKTEIASSVSHHQKVVMTASQFRSCDTALSIHDGKVIPLGKANGEGWPFKGLVDFACNPVNALTLKQHLITWQTARDAYRYKDKRQKCYYLTNACGSPPAEAKKQYHWPAKEVISDGKTSVGMDRTDDIKKGIYQTLKMGLTHKQDGDYKTAIISNLPAYRHGGEYIMPLASVLWALQEDVQELAGQAVIPRSQWRYLFDYIITLEEPFLRGLRL